MSVSSDHLRSSVCNNSGDGTHATGWVRISNGDRVRFRDYTNNGACNTLSVSGARITSWRICKGESTTNCSAWRAA